jgi:hypothetical protein
LAVAASACVILFSAESLVNQYFWNSLKPVPSAVYIYGKGSYIPEALKYCFGLFFVEFAIIVCRRIKFWARREPDETESLLETMAKQPYETMAKRVEF